jgi:predicted HAD superfamily phosphohydrolase YqeG
MDPKNQNKELYTDAWADVLKKPEQRAFTQTIEQMDTKQPEAKMSGNRHARGVRGEQRAGEG